MNDRPTSFHDFKWACGHTSPAYCKQCHDDRIEELEAEIERLERSIEIRDDGARRRKADNERLRAALQEIATSKYCNYENTLMFLIRPSRIPAFSESGTYGIGVTDGHRYCSNIAKAALEHD